MSEDVREALKDEMARALARVSADDNEETLSKLLQSHPTKPRRAAADSTPRKRATSKGVALKLSSPGTQGISVQYEKMSNSNEALPPL